MMLFHAEEEREEGGETLERNVSDKIAEKNAPESGRRGEPGD